MATLKHFAGYSASVSGRNMAPVSMGRREFADVILEPFEFALRAGGARAVMAAYPDMDGVPSHADEGLLTELLRDRLGFAGLVVSDYYAVSFLETQHGVAESPGEAAALALRAGVDMELPAGRCYGAPLLAAVRSGTVPEALIDRAAERVLRMKCELGLLDGAAATSPADSESPDLDPPANRELARRLAEEAVVLVANGAGTLPLRPASSIAVVGPVAAAPRSMIGCYSFPNHILPAYPELPMGVEITTVADAVAAEFPRATVAVAAAGDITAGPDADARSGLDAAVAAARAAEVCVLVVGDRPGIFGGGTSGEGCDAVTLDLPGGQAELAAAVLATGTPTVLVLMSGRPYALGGLSERAAAVVVAFLPGQEGGAAVAGVLSGRVEPSGRLPVSIPRGEAVRPGTYLRSRMAKATSNSSVDPTLLYPFGHGLTWTRFAYSGLTVSPAAVPTSGSVDITAVVRNAGERSGTEVVQLYLSDPVASVVRPERWLAGYTRVRLEPGEAARVTFTVHADRTSFSGADLRRIVEPGVIDVRVGSSSEDLPLRGSFVLEGSARTVGADRVLDVPVRVGPV
jgi:beta-xylosidase